MIGGIGAVLVRALCDSCGEVSFFPFWEDIASFFNNEGEGRLGYCSVCRSFTQFVGGAGACGHSKSVIFSYQDSNDTIFDGSHLCPYCGQKAMRFSQMGRVD